MACVRLLPALDQMLVVGIVFARLLELVWILAAAGA